MTPPDPPKDKKPKKRKKPKGVTLASDIATAYAVVAEHPVSSATLR